jgi:hypothetical protein
LSKRTRLWHWASASQPLNGWAVSNDSHIKHPNYLKLIKIMILFLWSIIAKPFVTSSKKTHSAYFFLIIFKLLLSSFSYLFESFKFWIFFEHTEHLTLRCTILSILVKSKSSFIKDLKSKTNYIVVLLFSRNWALVTQLFISFIFEHWVL